MRRKIFSMIAPMLVIFAIIATTLPSTIQPLNKARYSGNDRFQTSKAISEQFNSGTVQDVIITSGNNFPDALSSSVLAKKLNAPILLVDSNVQGSSEALIYITQHLSKSGTVHIIGGTGVINSEFEDKLTQMGYANIDRIGGYDRYDTDVLIAQKLNVAKNTPVVIASGENFPDALSISSVASSNGWPILLVSSDMAQEVKDFITNDQPSKVIIVGGTGVVPDSIKAQVASLVSSAVITRLFGQDRFDTAGQIVSTYSMNPKNIYLASGMNFPDALAGSVLASVTGDPILLIDPSSGGIVPPAIEAYLKQLAQKNIRPNIVSFGGTAVVPEAVVQNVENILNSIPQVMPPVVPPVTLTGVITSTATDDPQQNLETIADSLVGFEKDFNQNGGADIWGHYAITVRSMLNTTQDVNLAFTAWTGNVEQPTYYQIPDIAKQLFKFYLPNDYMTLYNMADKSFNGSYDYFMKDYTLDNRHVMLRGTDATNTLEIFISKPGQPLPKINN